MTRGLFDDLPPVKAGNPASNPVEKRDTPCPRPADGGYICRVGGGAASLSDNDGFSWFCPVHRPAGFYAHERGRP